MLVIVGSLHLFAGVSNFDVGIVSDQGSGHSKTTSDEGSVVLVLDLSLRLVTS